MFEKHAMLYLYIETPLHAGSGNSVGLVDLPIQRERVTNYPLVQASGIKGKLRSEAYESSDFKNEKDKLFQSEFNKMSEEASWKEKPEEERKRVAETRARKAAAKKLGFEIVFGPESDEADAHAGAFSPSDARLLLFPVRSLKGVFAWTTSHHALARFKRDLEGAGQTVDWTALDVPNDQTALTVDDGSVCAKGKVVLEEFAFTQKKHEVVKTIAEWLAENALPKTSDTDEYKWFRDELKKRLVILPEDAFRDFTQFATEVVTRIRIDQETKTVAQGALWTEEFLPADTVLYAPLHASRPRTETTHFNDDKGKPSAEKVLKLVKDKTPARIQLGGDETVGRGIVKLHFGGI